MATPTREGPPKNLLATSAPVSNRSAPTIASADGSAAAAGPPIAYHRAGVRRQVGGSLGGQGRPVGQQHDSCSLHRRDAGRKRIGEVRAGGQQHCVRIASASATFTAVAKRLAPLYRVTT